MRIESVNFACTSGTIDLWGGRRRYYRSHWESAWKIKRMILQILSLQTNWRSLDRETRQMRDIPMEYESRLSIVTYFSSHKWSARHRCRLEVWCRDITSPASEGRHRDFYVTGRWRKNHDDGYCKSKMSRRQNGAKRSDWIISMMSCKHPAKLGSKQKKIWVKTIARQAS